MAYVPNHRIHAPTLVFVPTELHYPHGYCARTTGARVTSARGSDLLQVQQRPSGAPRHRQVTPGRCTTGSANTARA